MAYLLVYEDEPVSNPYVAQLKHAPLQMLRGSRPMTLFFVFGRSEPATLARAEQLAHAWLWGAWERYRSQCGA